MSDGKDVINDARVRIKRLAASMMVRKESLEKEREVVKNDRSRIALELEQATSAGNVALQRGLEDALRELDLRIEIKDEEVAVAEKDFKDALSEIDSLKKLGRDAERAELRAIVDSARPGDFADRSPEDVALANVREHIENLEARVDLERELAPKERSKESLEELKTLSAKEQLAQLKAKRAAEGGAKKSDDEEAPAPNGIVGPKRTL